MSSSVFLRAAGLALTFLLSLPAPGHGQTGSELHPAGLDDVLSIEGIGEAAFSPGGHWLAYNLIPPYDELEDYSYWMRANGLSGHQLWVMDLERGGAPFLQPGLDLAATNYLLGFSPGGTFLIAMEHKRGDLRLVACRIGEDACTRFEPMPDIRDRYVAVARYNERLVWIDEARFAMPVRPHSLPGSEMRSRAAAGRYLAEQWDMAWTGRGVTASEVISKGGSQAEAWAEGDLYLFDLPAGQAKRLSAGRFAGVRASPEGRLLAGARTGERIRPEASAAPRQEETHPVFDRRYAPYLIETSTGEMRALTGPFNVDPHSFAWSADGARLAAYGWGADDAPENGCFYVFDTVSAEGKCWQAQAVRLAANPDAPQNSWPGPARAVFLGDGLAVFGQADGRDRRDWFLVQAAGKTTALTGSSPEPTGRVWQARPGKLIIETVRGVHEVDADGQVESLLPDALDTVVPLGRRFYSSHAWSNEFRLSSPLVREPLERPLQLVAAVPDGQGDDAAIVLDLAGRMHTHSIEAGQERVLAISGDARFVVTTEAEGDGSVNLLLRRRGASPETLARLNTHLKSVRPPGRMAVSYSLVDPAGETVRRTVEGCLMLPPDYEPGRRYPLLLELYPTGRGGGCTSLADEPSPGSVLPDLWTSRGLIYLRPALPLDLARTGAGPLEGIGGMIDQTIEALVSEGLVDPRRIVFYGSSQGGPAACWPEYSRTGQAPSSR